MLPSWLSERLASPPTAGAGVHGWLFSVARQLHAHMGAAEMFDTLRAATASVGRRVTDREIRDAVNNSNAVAWRPSGEVRGGGVRRIKSGSELANPSKTAQAAPDPAERWPEFDTIRRRCRISDSAAEGVGSLVDLWERSPVRHELESADDWLDWLLPDAEWLCLAVDHPATARSRRREKWTFGPADSCGLVVPSPMTGPSGVPLDAKPGERSHRCLDNTGPRAWLVIEFDPKGWKDLTDAERSRYRDEQQYGSAMLDEQAALHWHLRAAAQAAGWPPLRLCVHSGGKSLHGWFGPVVAEDSARQLMEYAVMHGADPATWNRCQLVRLPGGVRAVDIGNAISLPDGCEQPGATVRLEVFFYEP